MRPDRFLRSKSSGMKRRVSRGTGAFGWLVVLAAATMGYSTPAQADSITLAAVADTTLQSAFPNSNFGGGTTFTAGDRRRGGMTRALLAFDIVGNLPSGAIINSATLTLTVVEDPAGGVSSIFDLNRLLAGWGEGTGSDYGGTPAGANQATWVNRFGTSGSPWTTPGGDFSSTVSAARLVAGLGSYTFMSTTNLVADVQGWLDTPADNFGWILRSESESTRTTIERFGSRDAGANAPRLTLVYTLASEAAPEVMPEPSTLVLLGLGLGAVAGRGKLAPGFGRTH